MCPGCMTAAALQELGPNPAATLLALIGWPRRRPIPPQAGTGAAASAREQAAVGSPTSNQGG